MSQKEDAEQNKESAPNTCAVESTSLKEVSAISLQSFPKGRNRTPCKYFLTEGGCSYGANCKFLHVLETSDLSTSPDNAKGREKVRKRPPVCRYYLAPSGCRYGDTCKYRHPKNRDAFVKYRDDREVDRTVLCKEHEDSSKLQQSLAKSSTEGIGNYGSEEQSSTEPATLLNVASFPGLKESGK